LILTWFHEVQKFESSLLYILKKVNGDKALDMVFPQ
jgi:hypothetical protein